MTVPSASDKHTLTLVNALRSGELTLLDYLDELEADFKKSEPSVHAFITEKDQFGRLRRHAKLLEEAYPQSLHRPPLFGLPIGVKDIFHVDGFDTNAGSQLPADVLNGREAAVVTLLKSAGALIAGKTVTTEFAYFSPGPTRNPHNLAHTPGGSSSGSAAAVAAGLCPIALGTQTIGSVIRPASFCGVVGYKPSYDRISRSGVIPLSPSLDHVGVFASYVGGAELVASLLCPDWQLAVTQGKPVLGIPEGPYLERAGQEISAHFDDVCRKMVEAGCQIKRISVMPDFDEIYDNHYLIVAAEAAQVHADWYAAFGELYHDKTIELIERGRKISVGNLAEALVSRKRLRNKLTLFMDENELDLWITPSAPGAAPKGIESTGNPVMNLPWTHSGLPSINLPMGNNVDGLPLGLQIIGRWYEDETVLEWSAELEMLLTDLN